LISNRGFTIFLLVFVLALSAPPRAIADESGGLISDCLKTLGHATIWQKSAVQNDAGIGQVF
jgi:hypothetical protein